MKNEWTERQKKVLSDTGNLLVSASAGSGKTTIMLEKVLVLLRKGYDITRILVMTFSRAAASEMKEKLISKLYKEIRKGVGNISHMKKQLELINFSNISTIDSFCYSLFKKYFADIDYDPSFSIANEKQAKLLFSESVEETLEDNLENNNGKAFLQLVERFTKSRDIMPLKETIITVSAFLDVQTDEQAFLDKVNKNLGYDLSDTPAVQFYISHYRRLAKRFAEEGRQLYAEAESKGLEDIYKDIINIINNYIHIIEKAKTLDDLFGICISYDGIRNMPGGKKDKYTFEQLELKDKISSYKSKTTDFIKELQKEFSSKYVMGKELSGSEGDVEELMRLTFEVRKKYQKAKAKKKLLDYADLSRIALLILGEEKRKEEISKSFDFIFVDEYQDTNYIQENMIKLIAGKDNLFMVGDPKQAIYHFRHAEPKIFLNRYNIYSGGDDGNIEKLNDNFRSDKRVLDFVNLVFNEVMNYEFGGVDYRENANLVAGLEIPVYSDISAVEIATYTEEKAENVEKEGVYSVKGSPATEQIYNYEGKYIAEKISSLVGKVYISDNNEPDGKRLIEYSDIAIIKKKKKAEGIMAELAKSAIPYTAINFSKEKPDEIEFLVDYLRIINNMANDIPLANVMQSPIYCFSVNEMLSIRQFLQKKPFWETILSYKGNHNIESKINRLLFDLEKYRKASVYCNVCELLDRILEGGYYSYLLTKGKELTEQVHSFIDNLKDKEFSANITVFLDYYDNAYESSEVPPSLGNAVSIMTIHRSKGLEFPVVFLAGAHEGYTASFDSKKDVYLDTEFGIAIKYYDGENKTKSDTIITKSFRLKSCYEEKEELLRLMYVAMTRAKNYLFIVGKESNKSELYPDLLNNFIEWIDLASEKNNIINSYRITLYKKVEEGVPAGKENKQESENFCSLNRVYSHIGATQSPAKYSVSSLKDSAETEPFEKQYTGYIDDGKGREKGIYYHKFLELADFGRYTKLEVETQLSEFIKNGLIDKEASEILDIGTLERILTSDLFAYARENSCYREKAFMLYLPLCDVKEGTGITDKVLVQGVIDLLIKGEKNILVDFKFSSGSVEQIKERYKKQLSLYSLAVKKITGITVDKSIIYIINRNLCVEL